MTKDVFYKGDCYTKSEKAESFSGSEHDNVAVGPVEIFPDCGFSGYLHYLQKGDKLLPLERKHLSNDEGFLGNYKTGEAVYFTFDCGTSHFLLERIMVTLDNRLLGHFKPVNSKSLTT